MNLLPADLVAALEHAGNPERAVMQARVCNAVPGGYGDGDGFIGVSVPAQRALAKKYWRLPLGPLAALLESPIHEHRLTGILILCERYARDADDREKTYQFAFVHRAAANNWDLTDTLGPGVLGLHLARRSRKPLHELAQSASVWDRRLAMVSTLPLIRECQYADALTIAHKLFRDKQDIMHKAVGWMLREIGKKDASALRNLLQVHSHQMPRTTLRYAIESFPASDRKQWLSESKAAIKSGTPLPARTPVLPRSHGALLHRVANTKL